MQFEEYIIRPVVDTDFATICKFAACTGPGFTSLPQDPKHLWNKIQLSMASFAGEVAISQTNYLFLLEIDGNAAGITGVVTAPGYKDPFYNFRIDTIATKSEQVDRYLEHQVLQLVNDYQNAAELVTLFLHPDFRGRDVGKMLSRARFNFMAGNLGDFPEKTIAEIRGISDAKGISPFWEGLGRHFFAMDFSQADYATTINGKQFISDLMPRYPIYISLLPKLARKVIGKPHINSRKAMQLLEQDGFRFADCIDIFDAGPLLVADTANIKPIKNSKLTKVTKIRRSVSTGSLLLLGARRADYKMRLCRVKVIDADRVVISERAARALDVVVGDEVVISSYK